MDLLDIWAITTITNFFYRIKINIETYKVYADLGYIYDGKKLKHMEDDEYEEEELFSWFIYKFGKFIPLYNLYQSLIRKFEYTIYAKENIDSFLQCGIIDKMTPSELYKYKKNKSGIYAFLMRKKLNIQRNKNNLIVYEDGSSILFDYKYDKIENEKQLYESIKIIEVRGSLSDKREEQLIKLVCDSHITVGEMLLSSSDNPEEFIDSYSSKDKIELNIDSKQNNGIIQNEPPSKKTSKKKIRKR